MAKPLEFFFDYVSPFSYLADTQLPVLLEKTDAGILYKPILLGAIFKASNNTPPPAIPAIAQPAGCFPAYHSAMFRAMWAEGVNLGDPKIVKDIFERFGIDPDAIEREDVKDRLKANTEEAIARGAFGAPTSFVGDAMFWGNDRMHFIEAALK